MINGKNHLISFGKMNKYYILPFITPVFSMLRSAIIFLIKQDNTQLELSLLFLILSSFAYAGCGVILYIFSFIAKGKKMPGLTVENEQEGGSFLLKNSSSYIVNLSLKTAGKHYKKKLFLLLTIMAISPILNLPFGFFAFDSNTLQNRYYCFLFIPLLCKWLLGIKIYKHQIFGLLLSLAGFIIFIILFSLDNPDPKLWDNLRFLISCALFSLHEVLVKYLTVKYYFFSPWKIYISIGIIMLILTFIGSIIYSLKEYKNLYFFKESFDFARNNMGALFYIYLVINFILHVIYNIMTFSVIFYFNPNLYIISDIFRPFLFWIFKIVYNPNEETVYTYIFKSIGYFIQFISALIYNEIIIFNFCGLNTHTVKGIQERLKSEQDNILLAKEGGGSNRDTIVEMEGYDVKMDKAFSEISSELYPSENT